MARYRYDRDGKLMTYDDAKGEWVRERKRGKGKFDFNKPMQYVPDIAEYVSIATETPTVISSRSTQGRYERSNNIRQVGNDLKGKIVEKVNKQHAADMALIQRETRRVRVDTRWY